MERNLLKRRGGLGDGRRRRSAIALVVLASLLLSACGSNDDDADSGPAEPAATPDASEDTEEPDQSDDEPEETDEPAEPADDAEPMPLNLGILGGTQEVLINLMIEKGFDEDHNLDLEVSQMASPPALHTAITEGAVDAGFGSPPTLAIARDQGREVVVFRVLIGVDNLILAPEGSPVETLADLKGQKWGSFTSQTGLLVQVLQAIVREEHGFDPLEDAEIVEVPGPALGGLMTQGDLAAGLMSGGVEGVRIFLEGGFNVVADLAEEYERIFNTTRPFHVGVASTESFIDANTDTIIALNAALTDTLEYIEDNPDEVWASVAEFYDIEDERATELLAERVGPTFLTVWDEEALEAQMQLLQLLIDIAPEGEFIDEVPEGLYRLDLQP